MGLVKKAMEISILSGAVVFLHISNQDNPDEVLFYSSVDLNTSKNLLINNLQKKTREIFSNDDYKKLFQSKAKQSSKKEPESQSQEMSNGGSDSRRRSKRTPRPAKAIFFSHKDTCKEKEQQANDETISTISMANQRLVESHSNNQINLIPDEGIAKNCLLKCGTFDEETDLNTKNQTKNTIETLKEELNVDTKKNYLKMNNILEDSHINKFSINCNINDNIMLFAHSKEPKKEKEKVDFFQECDFNFYFQNPKDENFLHYDLHNFSMFSNSL